MKDRPKTIVSWALYDWANSAFATTVMAGFFPLFFKSYWANPDAPQESTFYLGVANSTASIIVALLAPFLGAIADRGSSKKKFLLTFAFFGIVMTASLSMVEGGSWIFAIFFYVFAAVGFSGGNIFYDSLLPGVASEKKVDFVSSLGFGLGYVGGGLLFLVNVLMYLHPGWFCIADSAAAIRISFLSVAVWWAVFSIPVFLFVREPVIFESVSFRESVSLGWQQLTGTIKKLPQYRNAMIFLLAYWLYIDGVDTIIRMAVDYGASLGLPGSSLISALLMVQFIAFPAAILYSRVAFLLGTKRAILLAIGGYCIITVFAFFIEEKWHFYAIAASVGLFQGGIQALSRSYYSILIPHEEAAQFFGFYNMLGKFAVVIGPFLMGSITMITGNIRYGILSILLLLVAGAFLLLKVKTPQTGTREFDE